MKKIVNLKNSRQSDIENEASATLKNERLAVKPKKTKAVAEEEIGDFLQEQETRSAVAGWQNIIQPTAKKISGKAYAFIILGIIAVVAMITIYFVFFNKEKPAAETALGKGDSWYAIKLTNDEVYYGQVADVSADPIAVKNVYYDYDQVNNKDKEKTETSGNLRLVKRGKETHGPDGSLNIIRSQVVFLEPLKPESKVLSAILDYEGK